jgi:hypothetical protein
MAATEAMAAAMTTEAPAVTVPGVPATRPATGRRAAGSGPDRLTVILFSLAAFLVVLAFLMSQLTASAPSRRTVVVMRREYRTTVITTIKGGTGPNSVSASVSSSGSSALPAAPTTRTS